MSITMKQSYLLGTSPPELPIVAPAILRKRVMTSQPQYAAGIDWSNPITRGLFAGSIADRGFISGQINKISVGSGGSFVVKRTKDGVAAAVSYSSLYPGNVYLRPVISFTKQTLFVSAFRSSSNTPAIQVAAASAYLNNPSYPIQIRFNSGVIDAVFSGAGTLTGPAYNLGQTYRITAVGEAGRYELWVDGVLVASSTYASSFTSPQFGTLCIGNTEYNYVTLNGGVLATSFYTSALSPSEIKSLSDNPYQIFLAPNAQPWVATP